MAVAARAAAPAAPAARRAAPDRPAPLAADCTLILFLPTSFLLLGPLLSWVVPAMVVMVVRVVLLAISLPWTRTEVPSYTEAWKRGPRTFRILYRWPAA